MGFLSDLSNEIRVAVDKVLPAVVAIDAWSERSSLSPMRLLGDDRYGSSGAGVIINPDGVVLTNSHVIEGTRTVYEERGHPIILLSSGK